MPRTTRPFAFAFALLAAFCLGLAFVPAVHAATSQTVKVTSFTSADTQNGSAWIDSPNDYAEFSFPALDWDGTYSNATARIVKDSNSNGSSWCTIETDWYGSWSLDDDEGEPGEEQEKRTVWITAYGKGTHNIMLRQAFNDSKGNPLHYIDYTLTLKLKCVGITKANLVSYKGKKATLKTDNITGPIKWKSSNSKIASVSSKGMVKGKKIGRCYIRATGISARTGKSVTVSCLVEVTYKKAYKAVQNAWKDYRNSKLKYSQGKRMSKNYRDCSSFVSRCYWDSKLKRKNLAIGGSDAKSWAYTAAEQARWLNSHHKTVAKKAVSPSKLLPGDTIYYETDYAGRNSEYRHIDHTGIYVGGGVVLNTSSWGPYGCIGDRGYSKLDTSIRFIGRPCK